MPSCFHFIARFHLVWVSWLLLPTVAWASIFSPSCSETLTFDLQIQSSMRAWAIDIPKLGWGGDVLTKAQQELAQAQKRLEPFLDSQDFIAALYRTYSSVKNQHKGLTLGEFQKALAELPPTDFDEKLMRALKVQSPLHGCDATQFNHAVRARLFRNPNWISLQLQWYSLRRAAGSMIRKTETTPAFIDDPNPEYVSYPSEMFFTDEQLHFFEQLEQNRARPLPGPM